MSATGSTCRARCWTVLEQAAEPPGVHDVSVAARLDHHHAVHAVGLDAALVCLVVDDGPPLAVRGRHSQAVLCAYARRHDAQTCPPVMNGLLGLAHGSAQLRHAFGSGVLSGGVRCRRRRRRRHQRLRERRSGGSQPQLSVMQVEAGAPQLCAERGGLRSAGDGAEKKDGRGDDEEGDDGNTLSASSHSVLSTACTQRQRVTLCR